MSKSKRATAALKVATAAEFEASDNPQSTPVRPANPEVLPKPKRRTFTAAYKADILKQAEACAPGELGALLRREGLYSSHLTTWRDQRTRGALAGLKPKKRGRKANPNKQLQAEVERLRKENQRLEEELAKARVVIDVQKKVAMLLGEPVTTQQSEEPS